MVTEQTKKEKMRKTVNCSLMIAGLFFFLNPNYGVLDVLPDFIGAALLLLGFLHFADIDDRAQSAKKALLILAFVNAAKCVSILLLLDSEGTVWRLVFTFCFSIGEGALFAYGMAKFFDAIVYQSMRHDCHRFLSGFSTAKGMTVLIAVLKNFLALLPELTALSSEYGDVEAGGTSSAEIAAFVFKALTFLNLLVVTIYGIGWFLYMVRYFRALRRERPFLATLGEQYEQEVGSRREVLTYNALKTAGILFFAGLIFALPLWLDGLDFLPDFVSGILMVLAVLRLYKLYPKKCRPALISGILYTVAATAEWVYALVFRNGMTIDYHAGYYRSVSTILARHPEKLGSYFGLVGVGIAKCILYAVFLCLICSVFLPIVEEHTGVAFELSSAESEEKKRKIQNDLRRRLNVLRGLSSAAAGGGIFFRCFRMFAEQMWVEYSEIVFALALFVGFLVFLNRLEEGIDNKYYLEK